ncbi:putative RNA-directed DNA polymerase from mobile element jockey-like 60, partial [Homarus americanus]
MVGVYIDGVKLVGGCWMGNEVVPVDRDVENCPIILSLAVSHAVPPTPVILSLTTLHPSMDVPLDHQLSIATLQPCQIEKSGSGSRQIPKNKSHRTSTGSGTLHDASTCEILPGVFKEVDFAKYLVFCNVECKPLMDLDIFDVHRSIKEFVGKNQIYPLTRMWSSPSPEESARLRTLPKVPSAQSPILCIPPLTSVKAVMYGHVSRTFCKLREAHLASFSDYDRFRIKNEILKICTRDKVSFAEARNAKFKYISTPSPNSVPPILSPQTSLVVAEAHMNEAGISDIPHLSFTSHPGTTRISAKCYRGSSESLEVDDPLSKVSMVESSDCCQQSKTSLLTSEPNSESQTLQQMSAQAGISSSEMTTDPLPEESGDETPLKNELRGAPVAPEQILPYMHLSSGDNTNTTTAIDLSLSSVFSRLDFEWRVIDDLRESYHYHILLSSLEVLPKPQVPCWWLDKAEWDLFKEIVKIDRSIGEFPSVDEAVEYLASLLQWVGHFSFPQTFGHFSELMMAAQLLPLKELLSFLPHNLQVCLLWQLDPQSLS